MYRKVKRKPRWGRIALVAGAIALGAFGLKQGCGPEKKPERPPRIEHVRIKYPTLDDKRSPQQLERAVVESKYPVIYANPDLPQAMRRIDGYQGAIRKWSHLKGVPEGYLEAVIGIESGGDPYAFNGGGLIGLGQLSYLACEEAVGEQVASKTINFAESERLREKYRVISHRISDLEKLQRKRGLKPRQAKELRRLRSVFPKIRAKLPRVDRRFDPTRNIADTARYLRCNKNRFDGSDWGFAIAAHHMGPTHLSNLAGRFVSGSALTRGDTVGETVQANDLTYFRIYDNSSPIQNPNTFAYLSDLDDDSSEYLFKVLAFKDARELWEKNRKKFWQVYSRYPKRSGAADRIKMQGNVWLGGLDGYDNLVEMESAIASNKLVYVPDEPELLGIDVNWSPDEGVGELATRASGKREFLQSERKDYGTLRPAALGAMMYLAEEVRRYSENQGFALDVTSLTRSEMYQRELMRNNPNASSESTHPTGYSFDFKREYPSYGVASATQYALEKGRNRGYWSFRKEDVTDCIHVDVNPKYAKMFAHFYEGVAKQLPHRR